MAFDAAEIIDYFKKKILDSIKQTSGGIFDFLDNIAKWFKIDISGLKGSVNNLVGKIEEKVVPDDAQASKGVKRAIDDFFNTKKTNFGIENSIVSKVQEDVIAVAQTFCAPIPELSDNQEPIAAYNAAAKYANSLYETLVIGDGNTNLGLLSATLANREAVAKRIVTIITGVAFNESSGEFMSAADMAKNPPKHGLCAMLANIQSTVKAKDFSPGSFTEESVTMTADVAALNINISGASNKNITNSPATIGQPGISPPTGKKPFSFVGTP